MKIHLQNLKEIEIETESWFKQFVIDQCSVDKGECFIAISFLGVLSAKGECYTDEKLPQGYHIISGVNEFREVFRRQYTDLTAENLLPETILEAKYWDKVGELITQDFMYPALSALMSTFKLGVRTKANKEFLPAGNWPLGMKLFAEGTTSILPLYVNHFNTLLGVTMAYRFERGVPTTEKDVDRVLLSDHKTDWTFGQAWLMNTFYTCNFDDVAAAKDIFNLEEQSLSQLEGVLTSFL